LIVQQLHAVTYEGSQRLRGKPDAAFQEWSAFMRLCSVDDRPFRTVLEIHNSDTTETAEALQRYRNEFGEPAHRSDLDMFFWLLDLEAGIGTLDFIASTKEWPRSRWGTAATRLLLDYRFQLMDPMVRRTLAGQSIGDYDEFSCDGGLLYLGQNRALVSLAPISKVDVFFSFPYDAYDGELRTMVDYLRANSCFKFTGRKWRAWKRAASSHTYVRRRMTIAGA
jgi:hypothetical protein